MHFRSTLIIPPEHRKALFADLRQALFQDFPQATEDEASGDWDILFNWYRWTSTPKDGALTYLSPESHSEPHPQWARVCTILAPYALEGSVLEWGDGNGGWYRFLFTQKKVVFQVGEIIYHDSCLLTPFGTRWERGSVP